MSAPRVEKTTIHIVDIGAIGLEVEAPSDAALLDVGTNVIAAFKRTGFAYLRQHGIAESLQRRTFEVSRQFFALDSQQKMRYERFVQTGFNGYTPIGGENTGKLLSERDVLDYKECYDFHVIGEDYPNDVLPAFSAQLEQLGGACCRLAERLLQALQMALVSEIHSESGDICNTAVQQSESCATTEMASGQHRAPNGNTTEEENSCKRKCDKDHRSARRGDEEPTDHVQNDNVQQVFRASEQTQGSENYSSKQVPRICSEMIPNGKTIKTPSLNITRAANQVRDPLPVTKPTLLTDSHRRMLRAEGCSALRVLNYPPVPEDIPSGTVRCAAHTDYGTLTLLFQDALGGLQVQTCDGSWIDATPVPDTILVNIGDLMETWTSGRLRATTHRVVIPTRETMRRRARQSIAMFVQPDSECTVLPIDGSGAWPARRAGAELRRKFAATYPAFGLKTAEVGATR